MPYDKVDTAAWWRGVEAMPPKPEEPGLQCRHVRLLPGLTNDPVPDDAVRLCVRREPASGQVRPAPSPLEVSVGDRVRPAHDVARRVERIEAGLAFLETLGTGMTPPPVKLSDIGPTGSGRRWCLMPRDPAPVSAPLDADTAGTLTAGHAGLARIEARNAALRAAHSAPGAIGPSGPPGPLCMTLPPAADTAFWARARAARDTHERAAAFQGSLGAMAVALRAADAVPDPRREAERRVVEAARVFRARRNNSGMFRAGCDLDAALDALAALDGEGGP